VACGVWRVAFAFVDVKVLECFRRYSVACVFANVRECAFDKLNQELSVLGVCKLERLRVNVSLYRYRGDSRMMMSRTLAKNHTRRPCWQQWCVPFAPDQEGGANKL
jgi:hypothetical protein